MSGSTPQDPQNRAYSFERSLDWRGDARKRQTIEEKCDPKESRRRMARLRKLPKNRVCPECGKFKPANKSWMYMGVCKSCVYFARAGSRVLSEADVAQVQGPISTATYHVNVPLVKRMLRECEMSQEQLACFIGVKPQALSRALSRGTMGAKALERLLIFFRLFTRDA